MGERVPVTVGTFIRAETDLYFARTVEAGGFARLQHRREMTPIDEQSVVRMNRDTLYSSGVFDLDAGSLTVTLPDGGRRFLSMQVISQDHFTVDVAYAPGAYRYDRDRVGSRYALIIVRILADPHRPDDMKTANALQDRVEIEQAAAGSFEVPDWDAPSQGKVRDALAVLATLRGDDGGEMFGAKGKVDPVAHLIGTAIGWGGNPSSAAVYRSALPPRNDGRIVHTLTLTDVPVDGFWSITVYNAEGYFEKNRREAYSVNSLTAETNPDGSCAIQFGGCEDETPNCLPIMPGWNYTMRLYRPRREILDRTWEPPEAVPH